MGRPRTALYSADTGGKPERHLVRAPVPLPGIVQHFFL